MKKIRKIKFRTKIEVGAIVLLLFAISISSATVTYTGTSITTDDSSFTVDFDDNWMDLNNMTIRENLSVANISATGDLDVTGNAYIDGITVMGSSGFLVSPTDTGASIRFNITQGGDVYMAGTFTNDGNMNIAGILDVGGELKIDGTVDRWINDSNDNIDTFIRNSNGNYWTATATNLQLAINDLGTQNGVIWLPANTTLTVTEEIRITDAGNITIIGYGCTIEPCNDYYASSTHDTTMVIENSQDIILQGIKFDGNGAHQSGYNIKSLMIDDGCDRILIEDCLFYNSKEGDITLSIEEGGRSMGTVNIHGCHFDYFGGGTTPWSVYTSGVRNLNMVQCHWSNYNSSGTPQCMYLDGDANSSYSIDSCTADNIYVFASVRWGHAVFTNCFINNTNMTIICGVEGGIASTMVDNCHFDNVHGGNLGGTSPAGLWVYNNIIHIRDTYIRGTTPDNSYGIRLDDKDAGCETRDCIIEGCTIENFGYGIFIYNTLGNHTIRNNIFKDLTYGLWSDDNTYRSIYYDNIFEDITSSNIRTVAPVDGLLYHRTNLDNLSFVPCSASNPYANPVNGDMYFVTGNQSLAVYYNAVWRFYEFS